VGCETVEDIKALLRVLRLYEGYCRLCVFAPAIEDELWGVELFDRRRSGEALCAVEGT
jgi:hypothetical protein